MSEPHEIHSYICKQCEVWKPLEAATFHSGIAALRHAVLVHPERVVRELMDLERMDGHRSNFIRSVLYDVNEASKA